MIDESDKATSWVTGIEPMSIGFNRYTMMPHAVRFYTLIQTARLNNVDPQAGLADVLARIADHPVTRLDELLPWSWRKGEGVLSQAA